MAVLSSISIKDHYTIYHSIKWAQSRSRVWSSLLFNGLNRPKNWRNACAMWTYSYYILCFWAFVWNRIISRILYFGWLYLTPCMVRLFSFLTYYHENVPIDGYDDNDNGTIHFPLKYTLFQSCVHSCSSTNCADVDWKELILTSKQE